jgi:hypothetical protein
MYVPARSPKLTQGNWNKPRVGDGGILKAVSWPHVLVNLWPSFCPTTQTHKKESCPFWTQVPNEGLLQRSRVWLFLPLIMRSCKDLFFGFPGHQTQSCKIDSKMYRALLCRSVLLLFPMGDALTLLHYPSASN